MKSACSGVQLDALARARTSSCDTERLRTLQTFWTRRNVACMLFLILMSGPSVPHADETLQRVIDSVRDYAIFRLDADGMIASWNLGAQLIKGYTSDEIIGKPISTFYSAEDREAGRPRKLLAIARDSGRVEDEGWRVRKDGSRFWADVIISAIRDQDGQLIGYAKVTRDLTERRAQEQARLLEAARFRAIVESARDYAIFALDPGGFVATWNLGAERAKGYRADEIIGKHFSVFYPPEVVARGFCERELEAALSEGRFEDEGWRIRKDGSMFWANVVITPLFDREGHHMGFSKITRDLSERRKWESDRVQLAQATEAVRLRDEFLSIASHELRTPLMALQLQLDLALEQRGTFEPKVASKLERASRNAMRLSELITALLDVGRISSGHLSLNISDTDLGALLHEVIDRLSEAAAVAKCEVSLSVEDGIAGVWDPMRISQVVSNLLANAFKYAAGTAVEVIGRRVGDAAEIRVRDHGPGIREEDRMRVFARFERASSRSLGGLGLGLYVAHQIVSAHGGSIRVDGVEGGGAVFVVELPLISRTVPVEAA
jgi:PAS domain S-box-containing protein